MGGAIFSWVGGVPVNNFSNFRIRMS